VVAIEDFQGEIGNLRLQVAPEGNIFRTGDNSEMAQVAKLVEKEMSLVCSLIEQVST